MELPKLTINTKEFHIDATPEGYALRILKFYRERACTKFIVEGIDKEARAFYDYMNECQDKRIKELDVAIKILEKCGKK
jgi:hypothetical protein